MAEERRESIRLRKASNLGFSVPIIERPITIYSGEAQSLMKHYNFTSNALFRLGNTLRRYAPEEEVLRLQSEVFGNLIAPLQKELDELEKKYKGPDYKLSAEEEKDVKFTKPYEDTVEISYPEARKLLDILLKFDQLLFRLAQLRFAGKIDEPEYLQVGTQCRNRIKGDEIKIEQLVRGAIKIAEAQAKAQEEETEFEEALESLAQDKPQKTPGNGRGNGRGGRRAKAVTDASPKGPGEGDNVLVPGAEVKPGEEPFSPFAEHPEETAATS